MPHDGNMFPQIPQTPRSKTRFEDSDEDDVIDHLPIKGELDQRKTTGSSLLAPAGLRSRSASPFSAGRGHRAPQRHVPPAPLPAYMAKRPESRWSESTLRFWARNRGVILVGVSQLFGALMNLCARLLERDEGGMHPFQILFARMGITTLCAVIYMYYTKVPHFPFGAKEVRLLLVVRGTSGFVSRVSMDLASRRLTTVLRVVWYLWSMVCISVISYTVKRRRR